MHIGWPQGILLTMMLIGEGISLSKYGQKKQDSYDIIDVLVAPLIMLGLLYWGGFFS